MAGTLVGGALLSSFLNVLFDRMATRQFLDFVTGSGKKNNNELQMRKLKMKLLTANRFVDDAEEKQMTCPTVRKWLDDLKDAVYMVGDLLDEINTEALRRKIEGDDDHSRSSGIIRSFFKSDTSSDEFDTTLKTKLMKLLPLLEVILNETDVLGLKEGVKDRPQERRRQTTSRVDESGVFGREMDRESIVNLLRANDTTGQKIDVLPIVGMGGVGKTTLAQLVYNDVKDDFAVRAWVCVGEEFDVLKITQTIYGRLTAQTCGITDLDLLSEKLEEVLTNKKFVFVLDDVWNDNYLLWNEFMIHFNQFGVQGSKIVVTTRLEQIASSVGTFPTHHLREISEDASWLLFAQHAFIDAGVVCSHPHLEVVGRQIVKKCKGLPLAAKSLGGLLHSVLDPTEWEKVLKSDIWELPNDNIMPALWLSYHYLPAHLKRCFAYCSIFPKDYEFRKSKSKLILLWMAEDLLQPNGNETMEEVGNDYFNILISRSFFQHSRTGMDGESHFTMHDLFNDLAKFVSGEFCLRLEDPQSLSNNVSKTRHFSFGSGSGHGFEKFGCLHEAKYLHTFLPSEKLSEFRNFLPNQVICDLLTSLLYLRVLNLSGYDNTELPHSIGNLKHLRLFDLSESAIKELPGTICTLYNLQTLLLSGCYDMAELPEHLGRLINLRHLDISSTNVEKMPPNMSNLKHLQILSDFIVGKCNGHSIVELKDLQNLGKTLRISGLGNIVHDRDALEADIMSNKKDLSELDLFWGGDTEDPESDEQVLVKLKPYMNLNELVIRCYGGIRFAGWLGDPSFYNLSRIELRDCKHCCLLPPLGQLPSLRKLEIFGLNNVVEIGAEFYGNDTRGIKPFKSLEELTFADMLEWQEWSYGGGSQEEGGILPNLCQLTMRNCPKLTKILPLDKLLKLEKLELRELESFSGSLSHPESKCPKFHSLSSLKMDRCPKFVCFPNGGMDAPKLKFMKIIACEKLGSLPEQLLTLVPSLESMEIRGCPELESFPQGGLLPSKLERLEFECSRKIFANCAQWGLRRLNSLGHLRIDFVGCGEEVDSFPQEDLLLQLPTSLVYLGISNLPNLTTIQGKELTSLISLEELSISDCPQLQCFPEEAVNSLEMVWILRCPKLKSQLKPEQCCPFGPIFFVDPFFQIANLYIIEEN
ncbi:hypothetical protein ACE6H2_001257 [Prunus campanulata]